MVGPLGRPMDDHALGPACCAAQEFDLSLGNAECIGEEGDQLRIGLAIHRWCGQPHFQRVAMRAAHFRALRAGLNMQREHQMIRRFREPGGHGHKVGDQSVRSRDATATARVTKPTTVTELNGIRMAAINGVRCPLTAKDTPVML